MASDRLRDLRCRVSTLSSASGVAARSRRWYHDVSLTRRGSLFWPWLGETAGVGVPGAVRRGKGCTREISVVCVPLRRDGAVSASECEVRRNQELSCRVSKAKVIPRDKKDGRKRWTEAGASGDTLFEEGVARGVGTYGAPSTHDHASPQPHGKTSRLCRVLNALVALARWRHVQSLLSSPSRALSHAVKLMRQSSCFTPRKTISVSYQLPCIGLP